MTKSAYSGFRVMMGLMVISLMTGPVCAAETGLDPVKIEAVTGLKGSFNADHSVFKVTSPRKDVKVTVEGRIMPPFMGLTSWAAFTAGSKENTMVMGDFVLFQDEVNPVMSTALDNGLQVTALHNHFFFDEPKVYFMHIGGEGKAEALAAAVGKMCGKIRDIRAVSPMPAGDFAHSALPEANTITPKPLEDILGVKGQSQDGMFKVTIGRTVKMSCGCRIGQDMGINTWAAFAGSDGQALVDGDFAVHEEELQSVLKRLRAAGINIVAIHQHMVGETPRTIFLHYWGVGPAAELARGLKSALDLQK